MNDNIFKLRIKWLRFRVAEAASGGAAADGDDDGVGRGGGRW